MDSGAGLRDAAAPGASAICSLKPWRTRRCSRGHALGESPMASDAEPECDRDDVLFRTAASDGQRWVPSAFNSSLADPPRLLDGAAWGGTWGNVSSVAVASGMGGASGGSIATGS